jgi:lipid-binding SYLF domain-containing protein
MLRFKVKKTIGALVVGAALALAGTAHATTDTQLVSDAHAVKANFLRTDPGLTAFFTRAAGYVVFPAVGKGGVGIGGAHGSGVVFQNDRPVGKATLSQVSIGAQIGGQKYAEVIFFETPADLANFMKGHMAFSGSVSAVALKSGASAAAKYREGVAVFTATEAGLMLEAAVGGQKFKYEPFMTTR